MSITTSISITVESAVTGVSISEVTPQIVSGGWQSVAVTGSVTPAVSGAKVDIYMDATSGTPVATATTDSSGKFTASFTPSSSSPYGYVVAVAEGKQSNEIEIFNNGTITVTPSTSTIQAGQAFTFNVQVNCGNGAYNVTGMNVQWTETTTGSTGTAQTDSSGAASIPITIDTAGSYSFDFTTENTPTASPS